MGRSTMYICPECGAHPIVSEDGYFCEKCHVEYSGSEQLNRIED